MIPHPMVVRTIQCCDGIGDCLPQARRGVDRLPQVPALLGHPSAENRRAKLCSRNAAVTWSTKARVLAGSNFWLVK
jgi:hypothetical protein